jgi:hypothetical protein
MTVRDELARVEIQQLANRYAHYMWLEDVDGYVSLFADDAEIRQYSDPAEIARVIAGKEEIRQMIAASFIYRKPKPLTHSHVVTVVSDTEATGSSFVSALDGTNQYLEMLIARYDDQYVLLDGAWKFKVRQANVMKVTDGLKRQLK